MDEPRDRDLDDALDRALEHVVEAIGGQPRDGQRHMAHVVAQTLGGAAHAIVQAGTGTGKSVAYLVPAVLHATGDGGGPVIVATATLALQRQLVERDLPLVADALAPIVGRPVEFAVLKGRNNYVCLNRLHGVLPEDDDEVDEIGSLSQSAEALRITAAAPMRNTSIGGDYDG